MRNHMLLDILFPPNSLHHLGLREYDRYFLQGQKSDSRAPCA